MSQKPRVTFDVNTSDQYANAVVEQVTCEDLQITDMGAKFLNGKGASATVVAFYPAGTYHRIRVQE